MTDERELASLASPCDRGGHDWNDDPTWPWCKDCGRMVGDTAD